MSNGEISYKILANVGTIAKYSTGWTKEVNIISWNGAAAKVDVRDWSEDHEHMSRGVTLTADETKRFIDAVQARDAIGLLNDMNTPRVNDHER